MKKYVFITMNISGINGAEQYIYNKMNFARQQGYETFIFSGRPGKILIDGFRPYEKLIHTALRFYPYCLSKKELCETLSWILSVIDAKDGDECIVESSNVTSALWGELIARELGCKHLPIIMQEHHAYSQSMRDYLRFKYDRHELSGIFDNSVQDMLKDPSIPLRPDTRARAYCNNVVQTCPDHYSQQFDPQADYTFGSIGRLEKTYVETLITALAAYFKAHSDKRYNLLLIGGSSDKSRLTWIRSQLAACGNVTLVNTGNLYPISRELIGKVDVFVSAAGSAIVPYYEGIPSIRIHHTTADVIGIIGYDYMPGADVSKVVPKAKTIAECIDLVLSGTLPITYDKTIMAEYDQNMFAEFSRQLLFGEESVSGEYYNVLQVQYPDLKYRLCGIVCRTIGVKTTFGMLERVRKLVRGVD